MAVTPSAVGAARISALRKGTGIPCVLVFPIAAGATADFDYVMPFPGRLIDAWLQKTTGAGGGAGTITVKKGATAITDAMSINIADNLLARALSIDDAQHEITRGGTLRITRTRSASTNEACNVYLKFLKYE